MNKRVLSTVLAFLMCLAPLLQFVRSAVAEESGVGEEITNETAEEQAKPDPESDEPIVETNRAEENADKTQVDAGSMPWNDAFAQYVDLRLYPGHQMRKNAAGNYLEGVSRTVYDKVIVFIKEVASGARSSTEFPIPIDELELPQNGWTAEELGVDTLVENNTITPEAVAALQVKVGAMIDFSKIHDALLSDLPYELYWYDKTAGFSFSFSVRCRGNKLYAAENLTLFFSVAQEYSNGAYTVNTAFGQAVETTVQTAQGIVDRHAAEGDYRKLDSYRQEICDLVSYNTDALEPNTPYGNPWQLIWVFDGDSETNVVCEGYAKAFQYLCDLSEFESDLVRSIIVTGMMGSGLSGLQLSSEKHMWNVVRMDDGKNYLVDVTNCDEDAVGESIELFLPGYTKKQGDNAYMIEIIPQAFNIIVAGYSSFTDFPTEVSYTYDPSIYDSDDLELSDTPYMLNSGNYSYRVCDASAYLVKYNGRERNVIVPASIDGLPVKTVGRETFNGCGMETLQFSEGIEHLHSYCVKSCEQLKEVTIPSTVQDPQIAFPAVAINQPTDIGDKWIFNCRAVERFIVAEDNPAMCSVDGVIFAKEMDKLLYYPSGKKDSSYTVPEGVSVILAQSMWDNKYLEEVYLPDTLVTIGMYAFDGDTNLREVRIPDSLWGIGGYAFRDTAIRSFRIPAGLSTLSAGAFWGTSHLESFTVDPNNEIFFTRDDVLYTYVAEDNNRIWLLCYPAAKPDTVFIADPDVIKYWDAAFQGCSNLTQVILASGTEAVTTGMFEDCSKLTSVVLPEGVTKINPRAFLDCDSLQEITLPSTICTIGETGFSSGTNANLPRQINYNGTKDEWENVLFFEYEPCDHVYRFNVENSDLTWLVDNGILIIGGTGAMPDFTDADAPWKEDAASIKTIRIMNGVSGVSDAAFSGFSNAEIVLLPDSITEIGTAAFEDCTRLRDVYYGAAQEDWQLVQIAANNTPLTNATMHFGDERQVQVSGTCGENAAWELTVDGTLYVSGTGAIMDNPTCWDSYKTIVSAIVVEDGITEIGQSAFTYFTKVKTVALPESLQEIKYLAFGWCYSLIAANIPDTVSKIEDNAFYACRSLVQVHLPSGITSLAHGLFDFCSSLEQIEIPVNVTSVADSTFMRCPSLKCITVAEGNEELCAIDGVLYNSEVSCIIRYPSARESNGFALPESVNWIYSSAFYGCSTIQSLDCSNVTAIWSDAFMDAKSLQSITLSKQLQEIPNHAFEGCDNLESISIPRNVRTIGESAFRASGINEASIPLATVQIGKMAFYQCNYLYDVYYAGSEAKWQDVEVGELNNDLSLAAFHYGTADLATWAFDEQSGILTINTNADMQFHGDAPWDELREEIVDVMIADSVTQIADGAFSGCVNLKQVSIPSDVVSIGTGAFHDCALLSNVYYTGTTDAWNQIAIGAQNEPLTALNIVCESNLRASGSDAEQTVFWQVTRDNVLILSGNGDASVLNSDLQQYRNYIVEAIAEEGITVIGGFGNFTKLTIISVPASVTQFYSRDSYSAPFNGCTALMSVEVSEQNTQFSSADGIVYNKAKTTMMFCPQGKEGIISIPRTVTWVKKYAFSGCKKITSAELPGVTELGEHAFANCSQLERVVLADGLFMIDTCTFDSCASLKDIIIPDGVVYICPMAFSRCSSLETVTIPKSVREISNWAFEYCSKLKTVYYPGTEAQWNDIQINNNGNNCLLEAEIIFGTVVTEDPETHETTTTITPIALIEANNGRTAKIKQSELASFAADNDVGVVKIVSGLGATTEIGGSKAPQVQITDDSGNVIFEAKAAGGQIRIDKKMNGTTVIGDYTATGDKSTAIDYVDIRLQYEFTLPEGVDIAADTTTWSWTLQYGTKTKTVEGEKYARVAGKPNTFTSNVVVVNVPVNAASTSFVATLTLSYVKDGLTYRIVQADETPLIRAIDKLVEYYTRSDVIGHLSEAAQAYVRALQEVLNGTWTPAA